jgi:hypothetical protein
MVKFVLRTHGVHLALRRFVGLKERLTLFSNRFGLEMGLLP